LRVLIIDDEDDIRRIASISLSKLGKMDVVEAGSGTEGLKKAREGAVDAILLDVMMPGLDGPSTLAALRSDPRTASIPVIFLTAKAMAPELERLNGLGVAAVLVKPFDPTTLHSQVSAAIGRG
jgi:CheY-like chemotaxis protein